MNSTNWKKFHFDGNLAWGFVDSPEEWERILRAYDLNLSDLLDTQSSKTDDGNGNPKFGFVVECNQKPTLGEWADKNSIDLSLGLPVT